MAQRASEMLEFVGVLEPTRTLDSAKVPGFFGILRDFSNFKGSIESAKALEPTEFPESLSLHVDQH